jgi:hypothetical protein
MLALRYCAKNGQPGNGAFTAGVVGVVPVAALGDRMTLHEIEYGLNVRLQNWAWRDKHGEREIRAGKVANVLIGIGAIFIGITHMMKGL